MISEITQLHNQLGELEMIQVRDLGVSIVMAPHPDDETLGCGGTMALLRKLEIPVHFIFVSDGTMSHPNSKKFPASKLRELREKEAENAVLTLGGDKECIEFLRIKDRSVPYPDDAGFAEIVEKLVKIITDIKPETIFIPWQNDPHPDHKATWEIISEVKKHLKFNRRILEYPIWLWELGNPEDVAVIDRMRKFAVNIEETLPLKIQALLAHESQVTRLIDDDPEGFMLSPEVIAHFNIPTEVFFESK
ncbi:PIG-L family deacetylase [Dyadobacter sp. CY345]|uniref:PIG-L deacetylase family protein n=1 Tax=Dyadobacter sp. CY345 TaxID=2909335 RepID=UPI001F1CBEEC|nr:PIG-L deacetylase family protein [Dyadobacter sp. CY345]MCF2442571.1 PIG-L family deacetylase [Dyadobacter sp. CY345]